MSEYQVLEYKVSEPFSESIVRGRMTSYLKEGWVYVDSTFYITEKDGIVALIILRKELAEKQKISYN
jgi:hypothetical protein